MAERKKQISLQDAILAFRVDEPQENVQIFLESDQQSKKARTVLLLWQGGRFVDIPEGLTFDPKAPDLWDQMWKRVTVRMEALEDLALFRPEHTVDLLKHLRMIYPDGTIAECARRAIVGSIAKSLGIRKPK